MLKVSLHLDIKLIHINESLTPLKMFFLHLPKFLLDVSAAPSAHLLDKPLFVVVAFLAHNFHVAADN